MTSGIYCIENLINGKKYIGQSADISMRLSKHKSELRGNYHINKHLQSSWNKYGEDNFKFEILLYCEPFELTRYEQFFVDLYTPEILYNICLECVDSTLGTKRSEDTKKKLSESHKGKTISEKTKKKMSLKATGKAVSKKTREKLSKIKSGKKHKKSVSRYFGVYLSNKKYWQVQFWNNNKRYYGGSFKEEIDAAKAYDKYVIENKLPKPLNFEGK